MGVSENIKLLRSRFELTQDELGKIAGVSGKAVHTWEQDQENHAWEQFKK